MEDIVVEDLFSNLPDEILSCIVSFLPKESALETSLISTRWRDLWNQVFVRHGTTQDMTGVVAGFLARFEEIDPLKHPRKLQFHFAEDTAVLFACIATNSKLLLAFPGGNKDHERRYELQFMLNKDHITHLTVPRTFLVKTLYLKSVSHLTCEVASSIVSNLENLGKLVIVECTGLQSLGIESESKLRKLTILDCPQLKSLHLRTSKLKVFRYRGPLPRIWPGSHFNLSHAMLDFRQGPSCADFKAPDFNQTLLTIKNCEALTLCDWTFQTDPICYPAPRSNSYLTQATTYSKLENLKRIKFIGFTNRENEILVAKKLIELIRGELPKTEISDGSCLDDVVFLQ